MVPIFQNNVAIFMIQLPFLFKRVLSIKSNETKDTVEKKKTYSNIRPTVASPLTRDLTTYEIMLKTRGCFNTSLYFGNLGKSG